MKKYLGKKIVLNKPWCVRIFKHQMRLNHFEAEYTSNIKKKKIVLAQFPIVKPISRRTLL